jgi:hypothetical protein
MKHAMTRIAIGAACFTTFFTLAFFAGKGLNWSGLVGDATGAPLQILVGLLFMVAAFAVGFCCYMIGAMVLEDGKGGM